MGSMKIKRPAFLLDTHVLLWWLFDDPKLSISAAETIRNPNHAILVSSASGWEIATKYRIGKLPHAAEAATNLPSLLRRGKMKTLPITMEHALAAGSLPGPHRDPFDRMLIAQARLEDMPIVTSDPAFDEYPVNVVW